MGLEGTVVGLYTNPKTHLFEKENKEELNYNLDKQFLSDILTALVTHNVGLHCRNVTVCSEFHNNFAFNNCIKIRRDDSQTYKSK